MEFVRTALSEVIAIRELISFHYYEFAKDFRYEGESHDFWELVYVDRGEVEVTADADRYTLRQGEMIFHKPNEFHNLSANNRVAPNVFLMTFECDSPGMAFFEGRILGIGDAEAKMVASLVKEGFAAFLPPFDSVRVHTLHKNPEAPFGAEQLVKLHLELLLIHLRRKGEAVPVSERISSGIKERGDQVLTDRVIRHMEEHLAEPLSLGQLAALAGVGQSQLRFIFKKTTGQGIMEYFINRRIEAAKASIREEQLNMTEISHALGFGSVHYFSRQFKKHVGMAPTEYARSVKSRV